jgi:osmotically inducible protein OsmC
MASFATTKWTGDIESGEGKFEGASGAISGTFSAATRFGDGKGTNPEELIAAAHSSCFSMALTLILHEAGHKSESVETEAKVTLKKVDDGFEITKIHLSTVGTVPEISEEHFTEHAETAKRVCPVSKALAGPEITLDAKLAS